MSIAANSVLIRSAEEADMPAVTAIYAHHVLHGVATFELDPPDVAEMLRRRSDVLAKRLPYLVATCGGEVVGYAYASTYRTRPAYDSTVENSVYLRPDTTGRGIGRRLLAALIEHCTQSGARQMVAVVGDSANLASVRLHESLGFRNVGVLRDVGWKHGRWLDTVMLQLSLGDGNRTPPDKRHG